MLASAEVPPTIRAFLESSGLLRPGYGRVIAARRQRHDTLLIDDGRGSSLFVKRRGEPLVSGEPVTLAGEAAFHTRLKSGELPELLSRHTTRLLASDDGGATLVFTGIADHVTLREASADPSLDIEAACTSVGGALGSAHVQLWGQKSSGAMATTPCPVQTHGRLTPEALAHGPRAGFELLRLLQSEPRVNQRLRELRRSWRSATLIHGDFKADNIVLSAFDHSVTHPRLVDWELAGLGEPRWDCGSLLGSLCFQWLQSLNPSLDVLGSQRHRRHVFAAFRTFWLAYEAQYRNQQLEFDSEAELDLVFQWAGYWLIQRVMILLPLRRTLHALDVSALHLACQFLCEGANGGPP